MDRAGGAPGAHECGLLARKLPCEFAKANGWALGPGYIGIVPFIDTR